MTNFLGYQCPACGDTDAIDVAATVRVRLTDDGSDADASANGDHGYGPGSLATCAACGHVGKLGDFDPEATTPTLDEALRMALTALNTAPRFAVPALSSNSYWIARLCDEALKAARER